MHPAFSVIVFTVASGAGFGLFVVLGLLPLFGIVPSGGLGWTAFVLAYILSAGGLVSSTFHLGHPERAWRALTQWRTSWLSREGVLAIVTLGVAGIYAIGALFFGQGWTIPGILAALLSLVTVYATSMIYASLKTVQRWRSPLTPVCYIAFSLAGGALLTALLLAIFSNREGLRAIMLAAGVLLILAWLVKHAWWMTGDRAAALSTPESATGLGHLGKVRLLESPHSGSSYLMNEMVFRIGRRHALKLRVIAVLIGGVLPLGFVVIACFGVLAAPALFLAVLFHLGGLLVERWLFFAEAEHAVSNYYDRG